MGSLSVRNLENDLLLRLKRRAARHGRSAEAEARDILPRALSGEAETDFDASAAELRALTAERRHTPDEELLREGSSASARPVAGSSSARIGNSSTSARCSKRAATSAIRPPTAPIWRRRRACSATW
jgi:plasmid stability protein